MAKALHAIDYLGQPEKSPPKPVCAAFGDDLFLRRQVLLGIRHAVFKDEQDDFSLTNFDGRDAEYRDVAEELNTLAMFGGQRLVVIEDADDFVTRNRESLEAYVARPSRSAVLVLDLKTLQSNTRLFKAIDANGLAVDCSAPAAARLTQWLTAWAKQTHKALLATEGAQMLVEMVGPELGLLDQELAKLALVAGEGKKITPEIIRKMGGSWRAKTTWDMLDLALEGKAAAALKQVDLLLSSGEAPIALLAQISASLRRLAAATRLILQSEATGKKIAVGAALEQVGVKGFFVKKTELQLRRLGRQRGSRLYDWLLEADLDLKGDSQVAPRLILERLIVRLAAPA